jgi:UDP-GlcNAc:undecaprenyl-phosphate GlcNAc-1-phosphate transferase
MANIGFEPRKTLLYLYGWTLALAGLALALRFVPYSDDRGNFDAFWSVVMGLCILASLAASIYVIYVLEILKLRHLRLWQRFGTQAPEATGPEEAEVDEEVRRELETGEFESVEPEGSDDDEAA